MGQATMSLAWRGPSPGRITGVLQQRNVGDSPGLPTTRTPQRALLRLAIDVEEEFSVSTDGGVAPQWSFDGREIYRGAR